MDWTEYEKKRDMKLAAPLIGKSVTAVEIDAEELRFTLGDGTLVHYTVYGDCCSQSYFYDIHGVEKLLNGGPVVEMNPIDLADPDDADAQRGDVVRAYGYEIVSDHPEFGEVTTALSFRNDSNGYYGGTMELFNDGYGTRRIPGVTLTSVTDTWTYDA